MVTAQHQSIQRTPVAPMLSLAMDAGLVRFRNLLQKLFEVESAR
jgi:hypothetical protein